MIAMVALAPIQISPTLAQPVTEVVLTPISGSDVDARTFEYHEHLVADGFATSVSMDLPVPLKHTTQTRVGFAVGLGDEWEEHTIWYSAYFTPYVKEMSLKVQGELVSYSVTSLGAIIDNTGTGDPSWEFFTAILTALDIIFITYDIYNFLSKVYQESPSIEWEGGPPTVEHWAKAIVRQSGNPSVDPRLQTACADFLNYFNKDGRNTLTITAEAEIYVQVLESHIGGYTITQEYIGTYSVSYEVMVYVGDVIPGDANFDGIVDWTDFYIWEEYWGEEEWPSYVDPDFNNDGIVDTSDLYIWLENVTVHNLTVLGEDQYGSLYNVGYVYIDDEFVGNLGSTFSVIQGTYTVEVTDFWESGNTGYRYGFTNWEDGSTSPTRTITVVEDTPITAHFHKKRCPGDVNGDGVVDIFDLKKVNLVIGGWITDPIWVRRCDVNGDGEVDVFDQKIVKLNMGN